MTKFMTESERPIQERPSSSVFNRVLLSLLLLGGAAVLFRVGLKPITGGNLTLESFQEPLQGAKTAQISLGGRSADLRVSVKALAGLALSGQHFFPQNGSLTRTATLEQKRLLISLNETLPSWRFSFGMSWNSRSPRWEVQLNRELATDLKVDLGSGDTTLNLEAATLKSLNARVRSGELNVTLPSSMGGQVQAFTGSGDLRVDAPSGTPSESESSTQNATFVSQTDSGEQRLDLENTAFQSVEAQSGSGDLNLALPNRSRVTARLKSGSGQVLARVPKGLKLGALTLSSGSGDVTIFVSPEAAVRATVSGNLEDFQAPRGYALLNGVYLSPAALEGKPALNLNLGTSSGEIKLITEESR